MNKNRIIQILILKKRKGIAKKRKMVYSNKYIQYLNK